MALVGKPRAGAERGGALRLAQAGLHRFPDARQRVEAEREMDWRIGMIGEHKQRFGAASRIVWLRAVGFGQPIAHGVSEGAVCFALAAREPHRAAAELGAKAGWSNGR